MASGPWGGRESRFQNNHRIYWSAAGGAHMISGDILTRYMALGGPATFGVPTTDVFNIAASFRRSGVRFPGWPLLHFGQRWHPRGPRRHFEASTWRRVDRRLLACRPATTTIPGVCRRPHEPVPERPYLLVTRNRAHIVYGAILDRYKQMVDPLGSALTTAGSACPQPMRPASPVMPVAARPNSRAPPSTGRALPAPTRCTGAIRDKWLATGGPAGFVGLPLSDEQNVAGVTGARYNQFQGPTSTGRPPPAPTRCMELSWPNTWP